MTGGKAVTPGLWRLEDWQVEEGARRVPQPGWSMLSYASYLSALASELTKLGRSASECDNLCQRMHGRMGGKGATVCIAYFRSWSGIILKQYVDNTPCAS